MMSRFILIGLLLIICISANASDTDWLWHLNGAYFGTNTYALDDRDIYDQEFSTAQYCKDYVATYHEENNYWIGDTGFYSIDVCAPLDLIPGTSKTWVFYLWGDSSNPYQNLELSWGWERGPTTTPAFDKMEYRLTYVRTAEGITGGNVAVGTSIILNEHQQGVWSFPVYRTTDGRTGYKFTLTAAVVPEPSSILALIGGIAGLGGFALKRRRS